VAQVVSQESLILQRRKWKDNGQCVVFVSGCFDLLHPGHVRLLEQARSHGDVLIVGVQSDASVRAAESATNASGGAAALSAEKSSRPVNPAAERAEILAALAAVDYVVEFDDLSPSRLIGCLSPDIIVEGAMSRSDRSGEAEAQLEETPKAKRVRILLEPGYSTTRLIERITQPGS
jgi:rfaE bifunctional protein nucleotidyltransferase chain/domain